MSLAVSNRFMFRACHRYYRLGKILLGLGFQFAASQWSFPARLPTPPLSATPPTSKIPITNGAL